MPTPQEISEKLRASLDQENRIPSGQNGVFGDIYPSYSSNCPQESISSQSQHRRTMREQHEGQVGFHNQELNRHDRAAAFFRAHPEFDEFILLIRDGVIQL